jgi:hypothetical protein
MFSRGRYFDPNDFDVHITLFKEKLEFRWRWGMDEQTLRKLKTMLAVPIDKIEEEGGSLIIYIPKNKVAKAIGSNGSVVRAAELVLNKRLMIKESPG